MADFQPTDEQAEAVRLAMTGGHLAIDALAGAAKTTTCRLIAEAKGDTMRGMYMAFNKSICTEASSVFPRWVKCQTAHSMAFQAVGRNYAHRLNGNRIKSGDLAKLLRIDAATIKTPFGNKFLAAGFLAGMVMKGIRNFSQSADLEPEARHIPTPDTMRDDRELLAAWQEVRKHLAPALTKAWADVTNLDGSCTVTHDDYLKMYGLSQPTIACDYLLADESQDLSRVMLDIAERQRNHAQLFFVGDVFQSIYQWRGSVNAMEEAEVDHRSTLTHSFRFGRDIAEVANEMLAMLSPTARVVGRGKHGTVGRIEFPDVVLSRTNAVAVRRALEEIDGGGAPHIVGGASDVVSFARGALDLQNGRRSYHPDLACFDSWSDVRIYCDSDELGGDLKLLVKLIEDFGADRIVSSLSRMPSEDRATIILSTAHAGKGREWASVQLADDFPEETETRPVEDAEKRLCYVGVTRAKSALDVTQVGLLRPKARA